MNKKVLVVDDDKAILEAFEFLLISEGFDVATASGDDEYFWKLVQNHKPDIIVLDVLLSGADGRDIARKLRSNLETKKIPIIMISALPDARDSSLKAGAYDFLAKPFEAEDMILKINRYINK